jgi:hypothetical protein
MQIAPAKVVYKCELTASGEALLAHVAASMDEPAEVAFGLLVASALERWLCCGLRPLTKAEERAACERGRMLPSAGGVGVVADVPVFAGAGGQAQRKVRTTRERDRAVPTLA